MAYAKPDGAFHADRNNNVQLASVRVLRERFETLLHRLDHRLAPDGKIYLACLPVRHARYIAGRSPMHCDCAIPRRLSLPVHRELRGVCHDFLADSRAIRCSCYRE